MSTEKILSSDGIPLEISLKKAERKKFEDITFKKEKDNSCKFHKTEFYHLYDSGVERKHQRNDILENRYNEMIYNVDKETMKRNLDDNLTEKFVDEINNKIKEDLLGKVFKKNPEVNPTFPISEDLPEIQKRSFYAGKTVKRNGGYDQKVDKIRND